PVPADAQRVKESPGVLLFSAGPWLERVSAARRDRRLSPEVLKSIRRKFGVTHRVLDVLVAEPSLQRPRVVAGVSQGIATCVPEHVRMDREGHPGALAQAREQRPEALAAHRAAARGGEDVRARALLAL